MNKILSQFCNMIDYRTYHKIKNTLLLSSAGVNIVNMMMALNSIKGTYIIGGVADLFWITYVFMALSKGENYTKDINEIKKLYQEFIHNYGKLNDVFGFTEPISIYTMLNYLIYDGYLSKGKHFEFFNDKTLDISSIRGAYVLNGSGCCRNITSMLTDVLNNCGISAANIGCYVPPMSLETVSVDKQDYSMKKILKCFLNFIYVLILKETL